VIVGPQATLSPFEKVSRKRDESEVRSTVEGDDEADFEIEAARSNFPSFLTCFQIKWHDRSRVYCIHVGQGF
jgi:hypothetical protein